MANKELAKSALLSLRNVCKWQIDDATRIHSQIRKNLANIDLNSTA